MAAKGITKKKIVDAAWKLFQEKGYYETTVEDIIALSRTSKSSFYHYFAGKDELTQLPGVGPALAERIIEEREKNGAFRLPEDLLAVRGIGAATLQRLLPYISLQTPEP